MNAVQGYFYTRTVKTVQENLGHHDAGFTQNQYGHVTEKMKQESADRMEGFIKSVKRGG